MRRPPLDVLLDAPALERYGLPSFESGQSPAVATDFTQAIDGRFRTRLVLASCRLVTDGNAANREVVLDVLDTAGNRLWINGSGTTQAASLTKDYFFCAFLPANVASADGSVLTTLAPLLLEPTFTWRLHVVNVQVGDQLSRVRFLQERFYTRGTPKLDPDDTGTAG